MDGCLRCGSHELREVVLGYGAEFRPDVHGRVPTQGETIVECLVCNEFVVVDGEAPAVRPLSKLTRPELEARAVELAIAEPEKLPNRGALRTAIEKALGKRKRGR